MEIRDVSNLNRINNDNKINKANIKKDLDVKAPVDDVQISDEALKRAEMAKIQSIVESAPDVRTEKLKEVQARLESGYYDSEEFLKNVPDQLMKALGL